MTTITSILADDLVLQCVGGSELLVPFTFYQDTARTQPVDLTGYHARLQARKSPSDLVPFINITDTTPSGITLGGMLGTLVVLLTDAQTLALPLGEYLWALQWQPPGHTWTTVLQGTIAIAEGAAHD